MPSFFTELKRRNVVKVGVAYAVTAWVIVEIASVVLPTFQAPDWVLQVFTLFIILGFPLALIFSWAFELTAEGLKRTHEVPLEHSVTAQTGQKLNYTIIGLLAAALAVTLSVDFFEQDSDSGDDTAGASRQSIAVLPFINRSDATESAAVFADGVHDDLLTVLANIASLKVISRTSVMEYRDTTKNMREIGDELGVATILEGGVQRAGNSVRINVQLIDTDTDEHLWAKTYDRELTATNIFAIQSEIAQSIASQLAMTLSPEEQSRINNVPTVNLDAYNAYLIGRQLSARSSFESLREAEEHFREAISIDPEYALAHLALARLYSQMADTGAITIEEMVVKGTPHLERAMELDDSNGDGYAVLGKYRWIQKQDGVDEAFKTAIELSPNSSDVLDTYANVLRREARNQEALVLIERALELDPLSVSLLFEQGRAYVGLARYEEARAAYARLTQIDPASPYGPQGGSYVAWVTGNMAETAGWLDRMTELDPDDYELRGSLTYVHVALGAVETAERYIKEGLKLGPDEPAVLAAWGHFQYFTGDRAGAVATARSALVNKVDDRWWSHRHFLRFIRDEAIESGNFEESLAWYRQLTPELFEESPVIEVDSILKAVDLALLLQAIDQQDQADRLLQAVIDFYDERYMPGAATYPLGNAKVDALALQGNKEEALAELRRVIDDGWRSAWQYGTRLNPNHASLHDDPEYQAMVDEIEADMAAQLERLRKTPTRLMVVADAE